MIFFLTKARHTYTMHPLMDEWGDEADVPLQLLSYEELLKRKVIAYGVYIFADIERLSPPMMNAVVKIADRIEAEWGNAAVQNHPRKVMLRYQLLTFLYNTGVNNYRVYRAAAVTGECCFPVFLRCANDHRGSLTGLLNTQQQLRQALRAALREGVPADQLLVTEYCDTRSEDGWFRKYAAFIAGGRVIPRHLAFHRDWMVKLQYSGRADHYAEEMSYLSANPHEERLGEIFSMAGIGYGRIDYSMDGDNIRVWEINTNPTVIRPRSVYDSMQTGNQQRFAESLGRALNEVHSAFSSCQGSADLTVSDIGRRYEHERFFFRIGKHARQLVSPRLVGWLRYCRLRGSFSED